MQRDPVLGGDTLYNPYVFPGNNPVRNVDPMGTDGWEDLLVFLWRANEKGEKVGEFIIDYNPMTGPPRHFTRFASRVTQRWESEAVAGGHENLATGATTLRTVAGIAEGIFHLERVPKHMEKEYEEYLRIERQTQEPTAWMKLAASFTAMGRSWPVATMVTGSEQVITGKSSAAADLNRELTKTERTGMGMVVAGEALLWSSGFAAEHRALAQARAIEQLQGKISPTVAEATVSGARYAASLQKLRALRGRMGQAVGVTKFPAGSPQALQVRAALSKLAELRPGPFVVGRHGALPSPRPLDITSHHGMMSRWMKAQYPGYSAAKAPSVWMPTVQHVETYGVFNRWYAMMRRRMGGRFDWGKVSETRMRALAEEMFDAAEVPAGMRVEYWGRYERMRLALERQRAAGASGR